MTCRDCGQAIRQEGEKALDGTWAVVWSGDTSWICDTTGDEHRP